MGVLDFLKPGVVHGEDVTKLFNYCKEHKFALPAVNVTSTSTVNAVLECAKKVNSPVIIQASNGGAIFFAGKSVSNADQKAAVLGSIAMAHHVNIMAEAYGVPVVLHTDHCARKLLPWLDGVLDANEAHFAKHGKPLFSTHMIDLSEDVHSENIGTTAKYLERMAKMNMTLEMEIGITGGEEDGVDNSKVDNSKLYTSPDDIDLVYTTLKAISHRFTIAAAFGNVHGVYAPGNVQLKPSILGDCQKYVREKHGLKEVNPCTFVFHGGSGSTREDIREALEHGVVKMNIDTDTQWGYWRGVLNFYKEKEGYLQAQIGNPEGAEKPNKKFYDPRVWMRKAEESLIQRLEESFEALNCLNKC
ncbi:MAG: uncharacterized protein KVP18_003913 [Porospora cf. gigantea A]|uniref:uncharacterized protein n=1 Tax=Porospora cf. gigantea A TaxID=2853593 RepID=UPI00355AB818|nr:MAG: hypothetical protein KVP18_003913 [Porospora cf. gigantea A]